MAFDPFSMLTSAITGSGKPQNADAGNYAPVSSGATTGEFYMGEKAGTSMPEIPIELIAIAGLFAWLMLSKR